MSMSSFLLRGRLAPWNSEIEVHMGEARMQKESRMAPPRWELSKWGGESKDSLLHVDFFSAEDSLLCNPAEIVLRTQVWNEVMKQDYMQPWFYSLPKSLLSKSIIKLKTSIIMSLLKNRGIYHTAEQLCNETHPKIASLAAEE